METKIIIQPFNILTQKKAIEKLENELTEYKEQGWVIKSSNMVTGNNANAIYTLLEK